jgi:hypothetical protein
LGNGGEKVVYVDKPYEIERVVVQKVVVPSQPVIEYVDKPVEVVKYVEKKVIFPRTCMFASNGPCDVSTKRCVCR